MEMGICVLRKHPIKIKKARCTCNSKNRVVNLTNLEKSGRKLTRSNDISLRQKHRDKKKLTAPLRR